MHKKNRYLVFLVYVVLLLNPEFWIKTYPYAAYPLLGFGFFWIQYQTLRQRYLRKYRHADYMAGADARFWSAWRKASTS